MGIGGDKIQGQFHALMPNFAACDTADHTARVGIYFSRFPKTPTTANLPNYSIADLIPSISVSAVYLRKEGRGRTKWSIHQSFPHKKTLLPSSRGPFVSHREFSRKLRRNIRFCTEQEIPAGAARSIKIPRIQKGTLSTNLCHNTDKNEMAKYLKHQDINLVCIERAPTKKIVRN